VSGERIENPLCCAFTSRSRTRFAPVPRRRHPYPPTSPSSVPVVLSSPVAVHRCSVGVSVRVGVGVCRIENPPLFAAFTTRLGTRFAPLPRRPSCCQCRCQRWNRSERIENPPLLALHHTSRTRSAPVTVARPRRRRPLPVPASLTAFAVPPPSNRVVGCGDKRQLHRGTRRALASQMQKENSCSLIEDEKSCTGRNKSNRHWHPARLPPGRVYSARPLTTLAAWKATACASVARETDASANAS
jgi:hypothetical protein